MYEALAKAAPQVPALVVLVVLVAMFLRHIHYSSKAVVKVIDRNTESLDENTKIQGQVLEALHRTNGSTKIEPVQHIEADHA